jgi:hypothetical protein
VLCIQDTTGLDFNGQDIAGLGPLSYEAQRGMYLHPTYAAGELAETRLVYVADREADIVALMAKARDLGHAVWGCRRMGCRFLSRPAMWNTLRSWPNGCSRRP